MGEGRKEIEGGRGEKNTQKKMKRVKGEGRIKRSKSRGVKDQGTGGTEGRMTRTKICGKYTHTRPKNSQCLERKASASCPRSAILTGEGS